MTFEVTSATYVEAVASAQVVDVALPFSYPLAVVSVSYLDAVVSYAQYLDAVVVMGHLVYAAEPEPTDTTAPTLVITSGAASIYQGATTSLNFAFSEDVGSTFAQSDVVVGGGASIYFDGVGDYLIVSPNDFAFGVGDLTTELLVYPTASAIQGILSTGNGLLANPYFYLNGLTPTLFYNDTCVCTGPDLTINSWNHVALTRYGTVFKIHTNGHGGINGVYSDSLTAGGPITIGASSAGTQYLNGHLKDLRITKGVARYTANFTPPAEPLSLTGDPHAANVVLLLKGEGANNSTTFVDSSPVPKTITAFGNAKISTDQSPFGGGTLSNFTGSGVNYSATFTGTSVGTASVSVASGAYADAAGNLGAAASLTLDVLEVYPFFSIGSTQPYSALSSLMSMGSDPVTMEYKTVPFTIRFGENS